MIGFYNTIEVRQMNAIRAFCRLTELPRTCVGVLRTNYTLQNAEKISV